MTLQIFRETKHSKNPAFWGPAMLISYPQTEELEQVRWEAFGESASTKTLKHVGATSQAP